MVGGRETRNAGLNGVRERQSNYPMGKVSATKWFPELVLRRSVGVQEGANNKWAEENVADLLQSERRH